MPKAKLTTYEYGAMSSRFSLESENKLSAYAAMCIHYNRSNHLIAIYAPEEAKEDMWLSITGQVADRLDEIFGGEGCFDKYFEENKESIVSAYKSIKQIC